MARPRSEWYASLYATLLGLVSDCCALVCHHRGLHGAARVAAGGAAGSDCARVFSDGDVCPAPRKPQVASAPV